MSFKFNPFTGNLDVVLSPAELGGSFSTIQPDAGTSPVATTPTDTLTLTSSDGSITITGNSSTDTVDFNFFRADFARGTGVATQIGSFSPSFGTGTNVSRDIIFAYSASGDRLQIFDSSNPSNVVTIFSGFAGAGFASFGPFQLNLFQNSLIGFSNSGARLYVIDVENLAAPSLVVNTTAFTANGAFSVMDGPYLHTAGASNLQTFQVVIPKGASASLRRISQFGISGSGASKGCAIENNTFFYFNNSGPSIAAVDVEDKFNPVAISSVSITGGALSKLEAMFVSGNYLYGVGTDTATGDERLIVVNVSNPSSMSIVSDTVFSGYGFSTLNAADLAFPFLYIGSSTNNFIVNVTDPTAPVIVGDLTSSAALGMGVSGRLISTVSLGFGIVEDLSGDTFANLNVGALACGNLQAKRMFSGGSTEFGSSSIRNELTVGKDITGFGSVNTLKEVIGYGGRDLHRYSFMMG